MFRLEITKRPNRITIETNDLTNIKFKNKNETKNNLTMRTQFIYPII